MAERFGSGVYGCIAFRVSNSVRLGGVCHLLFCWKRFRLMHMFVCYRCGMHVCVYLLY